MDTTSRKILNEIKKNEYILFSGIEEPFSHIAGHMEADASIRYLARKEYIKVVRDKNGNILNIRLDYRGFHPIRWRIDPIVDYILDHWIAVAALIISIISLVR